MKRMTYFLVSGAILTFWLASLAGAQSLADAARQVRKDKPQKPVAGRHFDNDNLPKTEHLSIIGPAPEEPAQAPAEAKPEAAPPEGEPAKAEAQGEKKPGAKPKDEAEERQKANAEWRTKIAEQRSQIELLSRELDVVQREYRLRAASFYADAGNRLRNQKDWDVQDADYKKQIAAKQKALDDAKQKLDDLQEQARKAGVPASMRE